MAAHTTRSTRAAWLVAFVAVAAAGLFARLTLFDLSNPDLEDHFLVWLEHMRTLGFWQAVSEPFSAYGYTPLYSYCLGLANALAGQQASGLWVIKSISILFDLITAGLMAGLAWRRWRTVTAAALAFGAVWFAPTVLLNGAAWGQFDVGYACWLLAMVMAIVHRRPLLAMACFGLALAVKAQAVFLGPFVLMLLMRRELPWRAMVIVPAVYAALALPVVLAGRSWWEVASIYATQAGTQHALAYGIPNLHFFLARWIGTWTPAIAGIAVGVATLASAAFAFSGRWIVDHPLRPQTVLLAAVLSAMLVPHLLPHMHERYFMPAEILAIAWAVWQPRVAPLAIALQATSLIAYAPFLLAPALQAPVPPLLAFVGFTNNMQVLTGLLALASLVHLGLLAWLLARWAREIKERPEPKQSTRSLRPVQQAS